MLRTSTQSVLRRSFTSQTTAKATVTKLSNGITVATQPTTCPVPSVGLVFGSGSSAENPYNNGVSKLLSNIFTKNDSDAFTKGLKLDSFVGKEYQSFISTSSSLDSSLEYLQSNVLSSPASLTDSIFNHYKEKTLIETDLFEVKNQTGKVMQHLHSTAFQNTPLALPTVGTTESLSILVKNDLLDFSKNNFIPSSTVIVGSGSNLSHEEFVKKVEKIISINNASNAIVEHKKSTFLGSEVRLRDDTLPKAWISIAVEGESLKSANYYVAKVAAEIFGSFNVNEPLSRLQGVKLIDEVLDYNIVDKYQHFSKSYKDSGLWGFQFETSSLMQIDDLVHFTLKQWNRLTVSISDLEVSRAKQLLKLQIAKDLNTSSKIINSVGSKTLANVESQSLSEIFAKIDSISVSDVKKFASERLWDRDIAIAGTGQTEGLLDYGRIRNDMSMMRW